MSIVNVQYEANLDGEKFQYLFPIETSRLQRALANVNEHTAILREVAGKFGARDGPMMQAKPRVCKAQWHGAENPAATQLVCSPMSYLDREPPMIVDFPMPVCGNPMCEQGAHAVMQQVSGPEGIGAKQRWVCSHCEKSSEVRADFANCAACKVELYCNRECQKAHWKLHKKKCCKP
mmetsp:Transcript_52102/g.122242  ORF Transcript_52102/g.122242 Transcript_52102/m.122242 type:complete len:177 (-) Transcript_52102:134-664(-)